MTDNKVQRGKFITLEGIEGVGKSTNMAFLQELLRTSGIDFVRTREPGGTPLAEQIRQLLLDQRQEAVAQDTELLLIFAARAQHIKQKILPALDNGLWVLCDRFTDATYAYQGAGRGIDAGMIATLEQIVQGSLKPDLTLLLDIAVEQGLARAGQRGTLDRFESEQHEFFHRARQCYLQRAMAEPQRFAVIDAGQTLLKVQEQMKAALYDRLQLGNF